MKILKNKLNFILIKERIVKIISIFGFDTMKNFKFSLILRGFILYNSEATSLLDFPISEYLKLSNMFYIKHRHWWWASSTHVGIKKYEWSSYGNEKYEETDVSFYEPENENFTDNDFINIEGMLNEYVPQIKSLADEFSIDGRAIASIITWEFEQSQNAAPTNFSIIIDEIKNVVGTSEIAKNSKENVVQNLFPCNLQMVEIISTIADSLKTMADLYFEKSKGIYMHHDPILLTFAFYVGMEKLLECAKRNKINPREHLMQCSTKAMYVSGNEVAHWVKSKLPDFGNFRTHVKIPDHVNVFAVAV